MKDAIYSQPRKQVGDFRFDESVAEVFPDMIQRSIPGYDTIVDAIGQLAGKYAQSNSTLYDLGCSLGAASMAMRRYVSAENCQLVAVDNSPAMVERCERHINGFKSDLPVQVICDDLQNVDIHDASVIVMNFTLQFIAPEQRQTIINRLYQGLKPGGILILSEKLRHNTQAGNELIIDLHHEFKRRNGYSELEISQKRTALENVMLIDDFATHEERLTHAGFSDTVLWFKCFNFASFVAIK
ncbi:carboxy-S-adenosyl-L-methionine synthase CmoA [Aestuariibacter sp. AA17]|uniref:Carboxy-S-adenosyl-L-methionine synthase n=1 Tax=Fluctibacter corallii TaxID=2984329 RepID=A0ABT3A5S4_9ALTE|nr:carboxy-S-adenosyl-L-methionine synthase CmoA [Aestuariibacter sp. AA17]MCV2884031.1 carboxy-S-adenosyl-L-methionine synthase CmoA [Aestuariibacter sp. AA17]